jgi:DNA-binding transcriptional ArsR family regulator
MTRQERPWIEPFLEWDQLSTEPVRYRIPDLLTMRGNVLFSAYRKTGKTTVVMNLIAALTSKRMFLGGLECEPVKGRVVYVNLELDQSMLRKYGEEEGIRPGSVIVQDQVGRASGFQLQDDVWRKDYADKLYEAHADVLIIDPIHPLLVGQFTDSNDNDMARGALEMLGEIARDAELHHLILVDHTGHADKTRSRGASGKEDWADILWNLQGTEGETKRTLMVVGRGANGSACYTKDRGEACQLDTGTGLEDNPKNRVMTALGKTIKPVSVADLAASVMMDRSTVSKALNDLLGEGNAKRLPYKEGRAELWKSNRGL